MSLINDALKRAQESQRPVTASGMTPIPIAHTRPKERPFISRMVVVVIFLLLSAAFAFIGLAMTGRLTTKNNIAPQTPRPSPAPAVAAAARPVAASPIVATAPVAPVQSAPPPVVAAVAAAASIQPVPSAAVVAPAHLAPAPPLLPLVLPDTLHVQGVGYDPVHPWAIVSGRTVYIGDQVKGVFVMAITRNSVTFGSHGQTNLLFVGQ